MQISHILSPSRTLCGAPGASKKRVLENVAQYIAEDEPSLDSGELFEALLNREKLGSTGLGHGIAIPHCRLKSCERITGCLLKLKQPVDFDAVDGEPVDLLFTLIVPEEANDDHLKALGKLAELFNQQTYCEKLRQAQDNNELYQLAVAND